MKEPNPDADRAATAEHLRERLSGFARGIGIADSHARVIIAHVIADEPSAAMDNIEDKARLWMQNGAE